MIEETAIEDTTKLSTLFPVPEQPLTPDQLSEISICLEIVRTGSTLIDDGSEDRKPWIHYSINLWPDSDPLIGTFPASKIEVSASGAYGKTLGTLRGISDRLKSGELRVATEADDVPPRPVMERFGLSRRAYVLHVPLPEGDVWIGVGTVPGTYPSVFDTKGHWVRSVAARELAFEAYDSSTTVRKHP